MRVSVILPVFNRKDFLREAVTSILAEKLSDLEVIVVDDGSTDGSLTTIEDLPVTTLSLGKNCGISAAMNQGIRAARGELITFLDSDDVLEREGLCWRVQFLQENPGTLAVGGRPASIIDAQGKVLPQYPHLLHPDYRPPQILSMAFLRQGGLFPLLLQLFLFRREIFQKVGYLEETLASAHDCDFLLRVLEVSEIPIVFRPVYHRRLHGDNHSHALRGGKRFLQDRTREEVIAVFREHGMELSGEFHLWETGYRPVQ